MQVLWNSTQTWTSAFPLGNHAAHLAGHSLRGVLAALELYQRKQHKLLAGLKGIEPIADDFLIEGCGDTEEGAIHDHVADLVARMD